MPTRRDILRGGVKVGTGLLLVGGVSEFLAACGVSTATTRSSYGNITSGIWEEPTQLNPILGTTIGFETMVKTTLFDPLFQYDVNLNAFPVLAAQVPTVANGGISPDGLTYRFDIRPGVKWSDGHPFTAEDVDFAWKTMMNPSVTPVTTQGVDLIKSSIVSADKMSITLHLDKPYAPFLNTWIGLGIPPRHVLDKVPAKQLNTDKFNRAPSVVSGPFMFKQWISGDRIVVVRNPHYWRPGYPHLNQITFKIIPDLNTELTAIQAGTVDVAWFLPINEVPQLKAIPHYHLHYTKPAYWEGAWLNTTHPLFADYRVRQALEYAIDRPQMVKYVWKGYATLAATDQPPSSWAYDPSIKALPFSPAHARTLLDAAGWRMQSDGYRYKNGVKAKFNYASTSGVPYRLQDEQIVQQNLKNVGIEVAIANYPGATLIGNVIKGNYDAAEFAWSTGPDPNDWNLFDSHAIPPKGGNWTRFSNPEVDKLIAAQLAEPSKQKRIPIIQQEAKILAEQLPVLFYYSTGIFAIATDKLKNYNPGSGIPDTWNVYQWSLS